MNERIFQFNDSALEVISFGDEAIRILQGMPIGTDLDGALIDTHVEAVSEANNRLGLKMTVEDIGSYYAYFDWFRDFGAKDADWLQAAMEAFHTTNVLSRSRYTDGFDGLSRYLARNSIFMHQITSRPAAVGDVDVYQLTHKWFKENDPSVLRMGLLHMQQGQEINGNFKVDTIQELGIKYFFEDAIEHAQAITEKTECKVILVPQPWNASYNGSNPNILTPGPHFEGLPKGQRCYLTLVEHLMEHRI